MIMTIDMINQILTLHVKFILGVKEFERALDETFYKFNMYKLSQEYKIIHYSYHYSLL